LWCLGKIYPWKSQKLTVGLRVLLIADARPRTPARECKQIGEPRGQHAYCNILWERWSREEFPDYLDAPTEQIWTRTYWQRSGNAARSLRDIKGKASQVKKFAEGINSDANGTVEIILGLIEEAEKLLESSTVAEST